VAGQEPRAGRSFSGESDQAPDRETLKVINERDCDELGERSGAVRTVTPFAGFGETHPEEANPRRGSDRVGG
jgi:hypothetical protein